MTDERHLDTAGWTESIAGLDAAAAASTGASPDQRATIGRYRVARRLGEGGMGVVWEAFDPELERRVAIKLLRGARTELDAERLRREAKVLAKLSHPNVIAIHDVGEQDGELFIVMQLVDGVTLDIASARDPARAVPLLVQAARGLEAAHAAGVVHRDFKPANVLVDTSGAVRVGDFGLAVTADRDPGATVAGTPAYMAPEQLRGGAITPATDQFAFCVTLWEALCGERPYPGNDLASSGRAMDAGRRRTFKGPGRVRAVLDRGLAIDPAARFPSMSALVRALQPRSRVPVVAAGATCLALAGAVWLARRPAADPCEGVDAPAAAVWNDERAAAVRSGLGAAAAPIVAALDQRTARWMAARVATCRAARAGDLSDVVAEARERCLDRSLADARAAIDLLAAPHDVEIAARAADIAGGGTDPADCSRAAVAASPIDPALDADLAALTAAFDAGRYTSVIARRAALEPRVAASHDWIATYQFWWDVGSAYRNLHDLAASKPAIRASAEAATAAGENTGAVRAWTDLASTSAQLGELKGVDDLLAMARAAAARSGAKDDALTVDLATAKVAMERGAYEDALAGCRRIAAAATPQTPIAFDAAGCVFDSEISLGRLPDAIATGRANVAAVTAKFGPDHPHTLSRVQGLAGAYQAAGDTAAAAPLWDRALAGYTALHGPDSLAVMKLLRDRAVSESPGGTSSTAAALAAMERAVAIGETQLGPTDPERAALLESLVFVTGAQPHVDKDQLLRAYDRAVAAYEKLDDPAGLARVLYNEADWWRADDRCDRAMPLLRRVVKLVADSGKKSQVGAASLGGIGHCLGKDKQWAEAEAALVDAIAQHDDAGDVLFGAQDRFEYAQQLAARGQRGKGVDIATKALADLAGKPPPADSLRAPIEAWLKQGR